MYGLPVTGVRIGWIVAGAATLIAAGAALMRAARFRRS